MFGSALAACFWCAPAAAAPVLSPVVIATYPHASDAFTEGLLLHDGYLYESTGLERRSSLRRVDPATGEVLQSLALPSAEFGEGLALVGEQLVQLTYKNGLAHVYDRASFGIQAVFEYSGEGWGLCYDGRRLIMTDGSDRLTFRDPTTFAITGSIGVQEGGVAYPRLNELECVNGEVFANVWLTDLILRIDPETGNVLTKVDASGLLSTEEAAGVDVLNGIAHDPATGHFLLTGKFWPKLFEVELDLEAEGGAGNAPDAGATGGVAGGPQHESSCALATGEPHAQRHWPWAAALALALVARRARAARTRR